MKAKDIEAGEGDWSIEIRQREEGAADDKGFAEEVERGGGEIGKIGVGN